MVKYLKINTLIMLSWYGCLRWVFLAISNQTSVDWLQNPISFFIAMYSIMYLGFTIALLMFSTKKPSYFVGASIALFIANAYCLIEMTNLFIKDFTVVNFAYFLLDCYILSYYTVMWRFCCMTSDNKILCPTVNINLK